MAILIQIPSIHLVKFLDELLVLFMMCLVGLDVLINHQVKKYKLLWIVTGIILLYALYSMFFLSYNTPYAIFYDFILQMKPFCYFCISYAIAPRLDSKTKLLLKVICIINSFVVLSCVVGGFMKPILYHVSYIGLISCVSFIVYLMASVDADGKVTKTDLLISLLIFSVGFFGTRSKFYGEFVLALYLLFLYVPGFLKNIKISHICIFVLTGALVLYVAWGKIDYYFITGGQEDVMFDEDFLETFARPALYAGMLLILSIHPLLGSGLASFATYASSAEVNYSKLYSVIDLDSVWGLSEDTGFFICDALYPELAQFGLVGIAIFVWFFIWIYKKISLHLYISGKVPYLLGLVTIIVLLIESIAATTFNQGVGAMCMMILGVIASSFKDTTKAEQINIKNKSYKETRALEFLHKEK